MNLIDYPTIRSVIPPRKYYYYDRHRYLNNATVRWINGEPVVTHQMNVDIHQFTPNPHESDIARNNNHSLAIQWQGLPPYAPLYSIIVATADHGTGCQCPVVVDDSL